MKSIELKSNKELVVINGKELEIDIVTTDLLRTVLNATGQGITASDMLMRIKILDKVEEAEKAKATVLEVEDNHYAHLQKLVAESKWSVVSKNVCEFIESFDKK
jgi:hypothetical protein